MKKKGSVADFKNNKANYKGTRITLNEAVLVLFFCRYLNIFSLLRHSKKEQISRKFKGNIYGRLHSKRKETPQRYYS